MSHQPATRRVDLRQGLPVLALALIVYLTTAGGSLATTDAVATYEVTRQIVEHGTVALPSDLVGNDAFRGPDGRSYSPFGLLQSIWNIPFYGAGRSASALPALRQLPPGMLTKATVALGNAVAAALCVWAVWCLTWSVTGGRARTACGAALLAAFATSLWPYSKFGFNVPLAALLVTWSVHASLRASEGSRAAWTAGTVCGLALLTRHELALVALPSIAAIAWGWRPGWYRRVAWWASGAAPCAVAWLWYNDVRFGAMLETGYLRDQTIGMGNSLAGGLSGLLFSPGGSVLLYSPVAILALVALVRLRLQFPRLVWLTVALLVMYTLFYAQMASWAGGRSYGPRYLVPFLPLMCVPLAVWMAAQPSRVRRWLVAWCVVSTAVQVPGVLVDFAKVRVAYARQHQTSPYEARMHTWEGCPLVLNARASARAVPMTLRHLAGVEPKPVFEHAAGVDARDFSQQFAYSLDFWWIYLFYLGAIPAWLSLAVGVGLFGSGAFALRLACGPANREAPR